MSLDTTTVRKIAVLARIRIEDEKLPALADDLNNIIGWVEQLSEVDTDGIAPMTSVAEMTMPFREDRVTDGDDAERVLANAPDKSPPYFTVPKVVE
ncbi:MAG: Asp-tRNA(Asn)/Glu-tRNA(Gln) amidotransferase subunit GatC [Rhodospirillales bacterium]|nr:Asp-tRNA(Asn)/Glu-tRNA(Gln) amidotransferase subunit GatC [Rhodospirillales bacterium]